MEGHEDLLERWQAGEDQAGQQLFAAYFEQICRFFAFKVEQADADDLVQRTFLNLHRSRGAFRRDASLRTYLFCIARRELHSYVRRKRTRGAEVDFDQVSLADLGTSPSQRLARARQVQQLHEALRRLPVDTAVLLELRYWEDCDPAELSEIFEVPAGAIRQRLLRARRTLREAMDQLGAEAAHDAPADALVLSISEQDL